MHRAATRNLPKLLAICAALGLGAFAGSARADDVRGAPEVRTSLPQAEAPLRLAGDELRRYGMTEGEPGLTAREDWQRRRKWRYGTQSLLPLTRGMKEAGIPEGARWPLYVFTVPFDTGQAFFGAIGGLYGD